MYLPPLIHDSTSIKRQFIRKAVYSTYAMDCWWTLHFVYSKNIITGKIDYGLARFDGTAHQPAGKPGVPLLFLYLGGVPQGISVCVLRRGIGRQHDFLVDDFTLVRIVFLFLVAFGKQPFAALVGSRRNGRLSVAELYDFNVMVHGMGGVPPCSWFRDIEIAGNLFQISCLVVPLASSGY